MRNKAEICCSLKPLAPISQNGQIQSTIRRQKPTNCLSVFDHFVRLALNLFHATDFFLYPLKRSENQSYSDVFRGYRKRSWHEMG